MHRAMTFTSDCKIFCRYMQGAFENDDRFELTVHTAKNASRKWSDLGWSLVRLQNLCFKCVGSVVISDRSENTDQSVLIRLNRHIVDDVTQKVCTV